LIAIFGLLERILFGHVDVKIESGLHNIFDNDFSLIDNFIWVLDLPQKLVLFIQPLLMNIGVVFLLVANELLAFLVQLSLLK
jgi:hypothetical protein